MNKIIYVEIDTKGMGYALTESIRAFEASPSMQTLEEAVTQTAKKAFEDAAKSDPKNAANITKAFEQMNDRVRAMIPNAEKVAAELEAVSNQLDDAKKALDNALSNRAQAAKKFGETLAQPFGEPSQLQKALSSSTATVDSIIGMYDNLVETVNQRFEGIDPSGKNALLESLKNQTEQLVNLARERESVAKDLAKAQEALNDALNSRKSGAQSIAEVLKSQFGQSSELSNALSDGKTTADSIVGMYNRLSEAINARYAGIDPSGKSVLLTALENQTKRLLDLVKKRDAASESLAQAQKNLENVLEKQADMKASVSASMKSYAAALANISSGTSASTIKVIKTATGMVITQMKEGSQGVQSITDQLKTRLQGIKDFATNIRALLSQGLNKEYVQQLLSAGPEAAGATASLIATAGSQQNSQNASFSGVSSVSAPQQHQGNGATSTLWM